MGIGCNVKVIVKKLSGDARAWIFTFSLIGILIAKVGGLIELPKRVATAESNIGKNEEGISKVAKSVEKVANSIDKYIAVQEARAEEQKIWEEKKEKIEDSRIALMLKLIEDIKNDK